MNIYDQIGRNNRATVFIVAGFILFFFFIGLGLDHYFGLGVRWPVFTVVALIAGMISSYGGWRFGDRFVISSAGAEPLDLNDPAQKQWQNVVEEVSLAAGIPVPTTYIIEDSDPNAFATGRNPGNASIVVTRGLLKALNREELQAVAAHEMSHIRNFDVRLMMLIAVMIGSIALLSDMTRRGFRWSRGRVSRREGSTGGGAVGLLIFLIWLVTMLLAPILSQLMAMCVSRRREYLADASGAELTRNPLALAAALEKIESRVGATASINQGTAHLCIADPRGGLLGEEETTLADLLATHPPMNRRIEALKKMAYAT